MNEGQDVTGDAGPSRPAPGPPDEALADQLGRLARNLEDEDDLQDTLDAIVGAAVGTVPGADQASIAMITGRRDVLTRAATGDLARRSDQAQYDTGQGPCLDALYTRRTVQVPDMAAEVRWPRFAGKASALGVGSMLSLQLYVKGDDLGALSLFSAYPGAFDEDSEHIALLFATHAAVAIVGAAKEEQLRDALSRRDIIGQAMGILMERYGLTAARAFSVLTRLSQHNNRKLLALAVETIATRDLPGATNRNFPAP